MTNRPFSVTSRFQSFAHAIRGLRFVAATQHNVWLHLLAAVIVIFAGVLFRISASEWCFIWMAISLVLAAEAFNTALELLTDLASPDVHPLAGKAKDAAAGAVLVVAVGSAVVGGIIFVPRLCDCLTL